MSTRNQLLKSQFKLSKKKKTKSPALKATPHKKGVCIRVYTTKPKKPNSATRKIAKLLLSTKKPILAYVPGQGHNLQPHSVVLIRGGRVPDLPGIKYHIIRGKYDFLSKEAFSRSARRSKFSVKHPKNVKR
jgi:small subunit ribosomal protein S12